MLRQVQRRVCAAHAQQWRMRTRSIAVLSAAALRPTLRSIPAVQARNARTRSRHADPAQLEASRSLLENVLRQPEVTSDKISLGAGITIQHHLNVLPSNDPCEDTVSNAAINGRLYYAVFDGHGGRELSRLLGNMLLPRLDESLERLSEEERNDDKAVQLAIQEAFLSLDRDVVHQPIAIVQREIDAATQSSDQKLVRTKEQAAEVDMAFQLAMMGSCALVAIVEPGLNKIHVACTGDSRAVMGTWEPSAEEDTKRAGSWMLRQLTEDQTSANPKEAKRLQSEHPPNEAAALVKDGRTLDLGMSRAFGDSMFKWSPQMIRTVSQVIYSKPIEPYPECKTPPYITARPTVSTYQMIPDEDVLLGGRRFVVLGSDGVFESISNEEIVGLIGNKLLPEVETTVIGAGLSAKEPTIRTIGEGLSGHPPKVMTREEAVQIVQLEPHAEDTYVAPPYLDRKYNFSFEDSNLATHLIRNAVAGSSKTLLKTLLSLPGKLARNYRDDMSVIVIDIKAEGGEAAMKDLLTPNTASATNPGSSS